jgi:hypothetical protein
VRPRIDVGPFLGRRGAVYERSSLAKLAAIRRASSLVSSLAAARRPGSLLEIDVGERLTAGVADDEAPPIQLGVGLVDGRRRREAALGQPSLLCRTAAQAPTGSEMPLTSLAPRSSSSIRLPRSASVLSAMTSRR